MTKTQLRQQILNANEQIDRVRFEKGGRVMAHIAGEGWFLVGYADEIIASPCSANFGRTYYDNPLGLPDIWGEA